MSQRFLSDVKLSTVSSGSMLKVDANGRIVAAVDGTDYISTSASSIWSTTQGGIYYSDKVRVGTYQTDLSPDANLHVFDYQTTTPKILIEDGNTGDASMEFKISTQSYTMGIDNSDSDKFVLAASGGLGTSNILEIASSGIAAFQNSVLVKGQFYVNSTEQVQQGSTLNILSLQNSGTELGSFQLGDSGNGYFIATGFKTSTASTGFLKADGTVDTGDFFSGAYGDLTGTPTLGTMAAASTGDYKTSDQTETYVGQELASYTPTSSFGTNAFTSYTDHSTVGYLKESSTQDKYLRSDTSDVMRFDTTTGEVLKFQNSTSEGKIQIGFQQNDTDGLHHRVYFKAYKSAAGYAAGKFDIVIRSVNGGTTADIFELEAGAKAKWQGNNLATESFASDEASAVQDNLDGLASSLGTLAYSSATIPTNNNQLTNGAGYITSVPAEYLTETEGDTRYINSGSDTMTGILKLNAGITNSNWSTFTHIEGANSLNNASSTVGAIRIELPIAEYNTNTMMSMTIKVYEYSTGKSFTLFTGGYNYNNGVWYNCFATLVGDNQRGDVPVKFGQDGTRNVIWIGNPDWSWSYPNVWVTDFQSGHTQGQDWNNGWRIFFDQEPAVNVTATETAHQQISTANIGSQSVSSAVTASSATTASTAGSANLVVSTAASGSVLMKHNNSEANAWIFQEAAANWGLYWFNTGSQSGQSIGNRYTTVGAEMFGFKAGNSQSAIQAPQGWNGVNSDTYYQWMISNYTGGAYFNSDVESRTGFYVNGDKVATESYAAGEAQAVQDNLDSLAGSLGSAASASTTDFAPAVHNHDDLYYTKTETDTRYLDATARKKWYNITASGTQSKRYRIARLYYCPKHWDDTWQNIEFELLEEGYNASYVRYSLFGYYNGTNNQTLNLKLKDFRGLNSDTQRYNLFLGTHEDAGWTHSGQPVFYTDVYVDVSYYKGLKVSADTFGHIYQNLDPTAGAGITVFYDNPDVVDITYSNVSKQNTYIGDNYMLWNSSNFSSTSISNWDTAYGWGNHASEPYATTDYVDTAVSNLVDTAPAALNTLNELAAALGDDENFSTTVSNNIGAVNQRVTDLEPLVAANATDIATNRTEITSLSAAIPTNNNQLTNGAGYITGYTETDTLATVTGRGASTSTAVTFNGGATISGTGGDGSEVLRLTGSASDAFNYSTASVWGNLTEGETVAHVIGKAESRYNTANFGYRHVADGSPSNHVTIGMFQSDNLLNILGNGNVGIGTTSPTSKLQVSGNIDATGVISQTFWTNDSIRKLSANASLNFRTAAGPIEMILDGSGNLGIGTSSPSEKLTVVGNAIIHSGSNLGTLSVGRSSSQNIKIYVDDTNNTITAYQDSDGNSEHIFALDRQFDGTGANNFFIRKGGSNQLGLDTSGNLRLYSYGAGILKTDANGNVSLDTSTYALQEELDNLTSTVSTIATDVSNNRTEITTLGTNKLDATAKAADSNLFDGIDSVNFVYGNAKGTNDSVTTDADGLDKTGYYTSSAFTTRPSSVGNWMYIEHIKLYNNNTRYQKQIGYDTYDNRMWVRTKNDNTWSGWSQIWTSDVFTNNSTDWNTAYGWGNHAGLYDAAGSAGAVNLRIEEEVFPAIDAKVSKAGDQVTGALSVGGSAAYDSTNLALDVQGNMGIWGSNKLYFKITSDNFNTWSTSQYADGSTHKFNAQAFSFTNEGYSGSVFMNINSSGVGMSRNLVLGNEVYGNLNAYTNWGARLFFNGSDSDAQNNYYIGTNGEDYGGNYSKLDLRWHTGIRIGARAVYGGIRFYDNEDLNTRIMSIGETDANIRIDNNLWIGGAGGWITDLLNAKLSLSGGTVTGTIAASGGINMNNTNITNVNHITINDAGYGEGVQWSNWMIYDSPDNLSNAAGNFQISSMADNSVRVTVDTNGNLYPSRDRQHTLGLDTNRWQIVFCEILDSAGQHEKNLQNPEGEKSIGEYETGTVLVWKGGKNVPCTEPADHMRMGIAVKGIASPLIQGAEPVLVTGSVNEGDYLVTSSVEGHAKAITPQFMRQHGLYDCVIGKALESAEGQSHLVKTWINI